jgi:hypothetical protein
VYGALGSMHQLSAWIMPVMKASCAPTSSVYRDSDCCCAVVDVETAARLIFLASAPTTSQAPRRTIHCSSPPRSPIIRVVVGIVPWVLLAARASRLQYDRARNCRSCFAKNVQLPWLLSCPAAPKMLPVRALCDSSTPLR